MIEVAVLIALAFVVSALLLAGVTVYGFRNKASEGALVKYTTQLTLRRWEVWLLTPGVLGTFLLQLLAIAWRKGGENTVALLTFLDVVALIIWPLLWHFSIPQLYRLKKLTVSRLGEVSYGGLTNELRAKKETT